MPAINDPKMTASLEVFIVTGSEKASKVINIDIVNPIPANKPIPNKCFFFMSSGIVHNPSAAPRRDTANIPIGLPSNKPRIIP